jgi:hypothetical protein
MSYQLMIFENSAQEMFLRKLSRLRSMVAPTFFPEWSSGKRQARTDGSQAKNNTRPLTPTRLKVSKVMPRLLQVRIHAREGFDVSPLPFCSPQRADFDGIYLSRKDEN